MKIDLRKLYALNKLSIDEEVVIPEEYYKNAGVRSLSKVKVNGDVTVNYEENIELHLNVSGEFIIPCAITLDDVIVPFNTLIEEEIDQNKLNDEFFLDLLDVLWENIVLEIPVRVVKEGVKSEDLHGEGWELVTKE
ncbi:MAG: YceD family protein [Bacilli bacterium]